MTGHRTSHHSHLREVDQVVFGVVWRPLLNESQVSEIHPQIGHTGRITAGRKKTHTHTHHPLVVQVCFIDPVQNYVLELNSLLQSLSQVFEPPL